jgi:hypothetical protein
MNDPLEIPRYTEPPAVWGAVRDTGQIYDRVGYLIIHSRLVAPLLTIPLY